MDSKAVNKAIRTNIRPWLKAQGFTKFTQRDSWREAADTVHVVNFQSFNTYNSWRLGCTTFSFAVNLGIAYRAIDKLPWSHAESPIAFPKEYSCQARKALEKSINQPECKRSDIWFIQEDGSNLSEVMENCLHVLQGEAESWFHLFSDLNQAMDIFKSNPVDSAASAKLLPYVGESLSMARAEIIAALSVPTKRVPEAVDYYKKAMASEFYSALPDCLEVMKSRIELLTELG